MQTFRSFDGPQFLLSNDLRNLLNSPTEHPMHYLEQAVIALDRLIDEARANNDTGALKVLVEARTLIEAAILHR